MDTARVKLLVGIDFTECSRRALAHAMEWLAGYQPEIHVVHLMERLPEGPHELGPNELRRALTEEVADVRRRTLLLADERERLGEVVTHVIVGPAASGINNLAAAMHADLIVMGTHGRTGLAHLTHGSVAAQVLRDAPCPVVCVKVGDRRVPRATSARRTILCPVDFSRTSRDAMLAATALAARMRARLRLVHVGEPEATPAELAPELERWAMEARGYGCEVETQVVLGYPAHDIVAEARDSMAELVVMGTHGRSGVARLLMGSVAEKVTRLAPCPVMTVHPPRLIPVAELVC
jgi:nucleotide-binding universal stress UspA family protein